jgi:hypothetical protein
VGNGLVPVALFFSEDQKMLLQLSGDRHAPEEEQ